MPSKPAVVLDASARRRAGRPRGRARRARSGTARRSSATGSSDPIRPRSQAASNAYSPALISLTASSSSVASLRSTIRSTVPASSRTTRPSSAGSIGVDGDEGDRGLVEAALLEERLEVDAGRAAATSPVRTRISSTSSGTAARAARDRVAGPARLGLEGEVDRVAEGVADGRGRPGLRDDERAGVAGRPRGPGVEDVGEHRPAAQRVEELGGRATSSACRARPPARRPRRADACGTWRVHEGRRERARVGEVAIPTRSGPGACRGVHVIEGWRAS